VYRKQRLGRVFGVKDGTYGTLIPPKGLLARVFVSGRVAAMDSSEYWHNDEVYPFNSRELLI